MNQLGKGKKCVRAESPGEGGWTGHDLRNSQWGHELPVVAVVAPQGPFMPRHGGTAGGRHVQRQGRRNRMKSFTLLGLPPLSKLRGPTWVCPPLQYWDYKSVLPHRGLWGFLGWVNVGSGD